MKSDMPPEPPTQLTVTIFYQEKARCFADLFMDRTKLFRALLVQIKGVPFDLVIAMTGRSLAVYGQRPQPRIDNRKQKIKSQGNCFYQAANYIVMVSV